MNPSILLAMFGSMDLPGNADYPAVDHPMARIAHYYSLMSEE